MLHYRSLNLPALSIQGWQKGLLSGFQKQMRPIFEFGLENLALSCECLNGFALYQAKHQRDFLLCAEGLRELVRIWFCRCPNRKN